jgi:hypothetical protein
VVTALGVVALFFGALVHPIHTTLTQLQEREGVVTVRVRAFVDDLSAAVARENGRPMPADSSLREMEVERYVKRALSLADRTGKSVPLSWVGQRRTNEVVWLELRAASGVELRGSRVRNAMLFEFHDDQVNIVQAEYSGTRHTTLFAKRDQAKVLP